MRVLFTSVPAPSHIAPLLELAKAVALEHEVAVATGPAVVRAVEKAGLRAVTAGLDWSEPEADKTFPELRGLPLPEFERWWVRNIFFDRAAHPMAEDVGRLLDAEPFDLVVRTYIEFGGWAAAAARDIPQVVFQLGQAFTTEQLPLANELLAPILERVDPAREVDPFAAYGDLTLLLHPESYDDWTPPVPWLRTRPPVPFPAATPPSRPDVLDGAGDDPVALVTFGTVFNRTPGCFEVVLEAVADLDVIVVATVGATRDPAEFGSVPANVRLRRFVPYTELLPHCDVVVGHGGFSTAMGALAHGLPLVIMPLGSDQPWHAANAKRLGLGEVVEFEGATPAMVADALTRVLGDPGYRERAGAYRDELLAMPTMSEVAPRIVEALRAPA
jgi:UDP:flavonoid glycosyltransferase YjiC (YdhE family)